MYVEKAYIEDKTQYQSVFVTEDKLQVSQSNIMTDGQSVINTVIEVSVAKALSWELQPAEVIRSVKAEHNPVLYPPNRLHY